MNKELENYTIDKELYQIYCYLKYFCQDIMFYNTNYKNINIDKIKKEVKTLFDEYFQLKNVIYYPHNLSRFNFIKKNQLKSSILINPFNIPIILNTNNKSSIKLRNIYINNQKYSLVQNLYLESNKISREIYAHEITHTQANYTIEDNSFFDDELLPIFIERLTGKTYNNNNILYTRLQSLYSNISDLNKYKYSDDELNIYKKIEATKYIESTLKAYYLYFLYINEPLSSSRARIIDYINDIFNDNLTIEQLLNNYDITNNYKKLTIFKQSIKH